MTKLSDLSALTGASVDSAADLIQVADMSETGVARSKKMTFDELKVAIAALPASYLDTDGTLAADSDVKVPSQKAVRTYVSAAVTGLLDFKGSTDASANPNYPAASKGDTYLVSVAGKIGGGSGTDVELGDVYIATSDNAGGTQAAVGSSWMVLQGNVLGGAIPTNIDDLADVDTTGVADGDVLTYDIGSGDWVAAAPTGGGGGSALYRKVFRPNDVEPLAANYATLDTRNSHPTLDADGSTQEGMCFSDVLASSYGATGLDVILWVGFTTATSGDAVFEAAFERMAAQDLDSDSFASAKTVTITANGTSGILSSGTISFSDSEIDSLAAGEPYRLRVRRVPADAADTITTDAEIYFVVVEE